MSLRSDITVSHSERVLRDLQTWVRESGAEWCGIQTSMFPEWPKLVIKNPKTEHIISLPFQPGIDSINLVALVRSKLEEDNGTVPSPEVQVNVESLQKLSKLLLEAKETIDALCAGRK